MPDNKPPDPTQPITPQPGTPQMPPWNVGELPEAPVFTWKNWAAMLGPGLLMGGAAIGGGEWLMGPAVSARYGGALMWLATVSILSQVIYNIEVSRYALYTGEPIFTGKFRTLPGPMFWLFVYLVLDFGSVFPYLAANAATPAAAVILRQVPDSTNPEHQRLLKYLGYAIFLLAMVPLVFGGKIYNTLKAVMTFKIVAVLGFLLILGIFYSHAATWGEIFGGFVKVGNVPIRRPEDANGNGVLDPGEDWDGDEHLDVVEPMLQLTIDTDGDRKPDAADFNGDGRPDKHVMVDTDGDGKLDTVWPDIDGDGRPDAVIRVDSTGDGRLDRDVQLDADGNGRPDYPFVDFDGDKTLDGDNIDNVFLSVLRGDGFPDVDLSTIALLAAFAAIAGSGGLSNSAISNYTRDQGWGMGHHVGAIPSVVGGRTLQLSHVGTVFRVTEESLPRWRRWVKHLSRDQLVVWMPACFLGLALPSMLSVEFLPRGTIADPWTAAGMTADGVQQQVAEQSGDLAGNAFWFMTLFCGFLVLAPTMASSIDGIIRRWVDVLWTASPHLRKWDTRHIKGLYFGVLCVYGVFGMVMLTLNKPLELLTIATNIMNFALGFSCWHTLFVNTILLPRELRPGWFSRICLFLGGLFFWTLATITVLKYFNWI